MKQFTAILLCALLVWLQAAPVSAAPACVKPGMGKCAACCAGMSCCASKPASSAPTAPAAPAPTGAQNEILPTAPALLVLPEPTASFLPAICDAPVRAVAAPLYARNCSWLI